MKQADRLTDFRPGLVTIGNEGRKVSLVLWCAQRPAQLDERQAAVYFAPGKSGPMTVVRKSDATDATVIALDKVHGDAPSRQCCPKRLPVVAMAEDCGNGVIQLVFHHIPAFELAAPDIPLPLPKVSPYSLVRALVTAADARKLQSPFMALPSLLTRL